MLSCSDIQREKVSCFSNMGLMEELRASGTRQHPLFTLFDENFMFCVSVSTLDGHWPLVNKIQSSLVQFVLNDHEASKELSTLMLWSRK